LQAFAAAIKKVSFSEVRVLTSPRRLFPFTELLGASGSHANCLENKKEKTQ